RAFEGDPAVLQHDVNRGNLGNGVTLQRGVLEDGAVHRPACVVVGGRFGQHFYLVVHGGDTFDAFYGRFGVGPQGGPQHLAAEGDFVAVQRKRDVVEHGVEGKHQQLMVN